MSEVEYLSTTLIGNYPLCPSRSIHSHLTRIEHGDDEEGSNPTRFGSIVHEVCEEYHRLAMRGEDPPAPIDLFDQKWQEAKCYDQDYYALGRDNIEEFLERTIHDRNGETVGVETPFVLDIVSGDIYLHVEGDDAREVAAQIRDNGGVPVKSKIDRIDKVDDETYEIYDYKTNYRPYTRDEIENSLQLGIYDMAVRAIYPDATSVKCVFDMFRHGRQAVIFNDDQREEKKQFIINLWHQIRNADEHPEQINKYCRWCEIRGNCSSYQDVLDADVQEVIAWEDDEPLDQDRLDELWDRYEELKNRERIIKKRRREIRDMFSSVASEESHDGTVPLGGREIYFSPNPRYEYPMEDLWPVLSASDRLVLLKDVAKVSKTKLERKLRDHPDLKDRVEQLLITRYVRPSIGVRKARNEEDD